MHIPTLAVLLTQLHVTAPGKAMEDGPNAWAPATHVGNLDGAAGSWFLPSPAYYWGHLGVEY